MLDFEEATRVVVDGDRLTARLSSDWQTFGPIGGYLATIALRAAGLRSSLRRPTSFDCSFLARGAFDAVALEVRSLRKSKNTECLRVSMTQADAQLLEGHVWMTQDAPGFVHDTSTMPSVPLPESIRPTRDLPTAIRQQMAPIWLYLDGGLISWRHTRGEPGDPTMQGWYRYPRDHYDDPFVDAGRVLTLLDLITTTSAFAHHIDAMCIVPTMRLSVAFHRPIPPGWFMCEASAPISQGGTLYGHGDAWANGMLVASAHSQARCLGAPQSFRWPDWPEPQEPPPGPSQG